MSRAQRVAILSCIGLFLASCSESPSGPTGPLQLSVVSGNNQSGNPGEELPNPLVVLVENDRGKPVKDQIVNFRVTQGGGTVFAGVAITNRDGIAQERWTLGSSGSQRLEARAVSSETGAPLTFAVFNATINDHAAPAVTGVAVIALTVSASVSDAGSGGSVITGAEYRLDGGALQPMLADDGAYEEATEDVHASLGSPAVGPHTVCVRGTDAAGNTSAEACANFSVEPPPAAAVYVATSGDDTNAGTQASPLRTVNAGITKAFLLGVDRVNIAQGTYVEQVAVADGISLYGGYQASDWTRLPGITTTIQGSLGQPAIVTTGITQPTTIDRLGAITTNGSFGHRSSIAMLISGANGLTITGSLLRSGNGVGGLDGPSGPAGANGVDGGPGFPGQPDGTFGQGGPGGALACLGAGVNGGAGGRGGSEGSNSGLAGATGQGTNPGGGGAGGAGGDPGHAGSNGQAGGFGANGTNGPGGGAIGSIVGTDYIPADGGDGATGAPGSGGGGGGGGGGQGGTFVDDGGGNGGGGGGSGGCGGTGGRGGSGGGASIALLVINSASVTVTNTAIETGIGGAGGNGGTGGDGGVGANGGNGASNATDEIGRGGNGGDGGDGGRGGNGGGGGGGPSIGIMRSGGSPLTLSGNVFSIGPAGPGGGPNGSAGVTASVFP